MTHDPVLKECVDEIISKDVFIFDIDGTVLIGNRPVEGVRDFLTYLLGKGKKIVFLTNNDSMPPDDHLNRICEILNLPKDKVYVFSCIQHVMRILKRKNLMRVFPVLTSSVSKYLENNGVELCFSNPELILIGFDIELEYSKIRDATLFIQKGIPWALSHPDSRCPSEEGFIPDAGSIAALVKETTLTEPLFVAGKPDPEMIWMIAEELNVELEDVCFFGDRINTDVEMGVRSGVFTVLMLTGETSFNEARDYLAIRDIARLLVLENWNILVDTLLTEV